MHPWKDIFVRLLDAGKVLAKWHLSSGVTFYMLLIDEADRLLDTGVQARSFFEYQEIDYLEILWCVELVRPFFKSDVDKCLERLQGADRAEIIHIPGGIRIQVK